MTIILSKFPSCDIELEYTNKNKVVVGMDEVGRGSWAGPLVMCAVLPGESIIKDVRDSKKILQKKREFLSTEIKKWAKAYSIGVVNNDEIDQFFVKINFQI